MRPSPLGSGHRLPYRWPKIVVSRSGYRAGRDASARRHFGRALVLVQVGGDHQLTAHILGSMSHLASYLGAPDEAVALARQGQAALHAGAANSALEARMLALEARGVAGKDPADPAECARLLLRAERALEDTPAASVSTWVSHFDEGSLASEATRCLRQLGDLEQARQRPDRSARTGSGRRHRRRCARRHPVPRLLPGDQPADPAPAAARAVHRQCGRRRVPRLPPRCRSRPAGVLPADRRRPASARG